MTNPKSPTSEPTHIPALVLPIRNPRPIPSPPLQNWHVYMHLYSLSEIQDRSQVPHFRTDTYTCTCTSHQKSKTDPKSPTSKLYLHFPSEIWQWTPKWTAAASSKKCPSLAPLHGMTQLQSSFLFPRLSQTCHAFPLMLLFSSPITTSPCSYSLES